MSEKAKNHVQELNLTEKQQERRAVAKKWLTDAETLISDELESAKLEAKKISKAKYAGATLVAPPLHTAPEHIKRGTKIDQDIWMAESAVPDEYEAERDGYGQYPTIEEEAADRKVEDLDELLYGNGSRHEYGITGAFETFETGVVPEGYPIDDVRHYMSWCVDKYADLEDARQAAIADEQPDPIRTQIETLFNA